MLDKLKNLFKKKPKEVKEEAPIERKKSNWKKVKTEPEPEPIAEPVEPPRKPKWKKVKPQ